MGWVEVVALLVGYVFQFMANQQKAVSDALLRSIERDKVTDSLANSASKRGLDGGKWNRRFIIFSCICAIVWLPGLFTYINIPLVVETTTTVKGWVWGLFPDKIIVDFIPVYGWLMSESNKEILSAIVFFYFGKSGAKS